MMHCVGRFDNSADNPNNPAPSRPVTFGEQNTSTFMTATNTAMIPPTGAKQGTSTTAF